MCIRDSPSPPTALVTANNAMTIGALRALRDRGLSVPHDIALCCFDDFAWADLFSPRLTAIAQPSKDIGAHAVRVLLDRLDSPDRPARTVRLPCAFVHRTSCGCAEPFPGREPTQSARSGAPVGAERPARCEQSARREQPTQREQPAGPGKPDGRAEPSASDSPVQSLTSVEGTVS